LTTYDPSGLPARLRAWARGSSPRTAAVEFLLATGTELTGRLVRDDGERARLDVFNVPAAEWASRVGWMSSGQRATWELARSMVDGGLEEWFWRLDTDRKLALVAALSAGLVEERAAGEAVRAGLPREHRCRAGGMSGWSTTTTSL